MRELQVLNDHKALAEKQMLFELDHCHYKPVPVKPPIVSALGAIPKKYSNSIRLIHDCFRPTANCVNSYAISDPFQYQTLQEAIGMITPNCYQGGFISSLQSGETRPLQSRCHRTQIP